MCDMFQSAAPWVVTAMFAVVALWCRLVAKAARAELDALDCATSKALNECDRLRKQLAEKTAAIDVAWKALGPVSLRARVAKSILDPSQSTGGWG